MKFSISTWIWDSPITTEKLTTLVPHIAALGFDGVELPIEDISHVDYVRVVDLVERYSLEPSIVAVMSAERDFVHKEARVRHNAVAYLRHLIQALEILRGKRIIGPLYSAVGRLWRTTSRERENLMQLLIPQLRQLADDATEHGVILCVEPVHRHETSFINTTDQAIELVDKVNHPALQLGLDTYHMNIEDRAFGDSIRKAGSRLRHFHIGENDRGMLGKGHIPWGEVSQALRDINYADFVVIETFSGKVESIASAAAIWRQLTDSPDALASEGLEFMQRTFAWRKNLR